MFHLTHYRFKNQTKINRKREIGKVRNCIDQNLLSAKFQSPVFSSVFFFFHFINTIYKPMILHLYNPVRLKRKKEKYKGIFFPFSEVLLLRRSVFELLTRL